MTDAVITHTDNKEPTAFTQKELDWLPWLEPLAEGDFTERRREALVDPTRIKSPYFRLQQNDVVFVDQVHRKIKQQEQQALLQQIAIASSVLTVAALILNYVKK